MIFIYSPGITHSTQQKLKESRGIYIYIRNMYMGRRAKKKKKENSLLRLGCKKSKLAQLAWLNCLAMVKLEQSSLRIHCSCSH